MKDTLEATAQQMLGGAAGPVEIHTKDRVWKVGHPSQTAKGRLEELVAQHARREILRLGGTAAEWREAVEAGHYATRNPGWLRVMSSPTSPALYLLSLLREHHPDITQAEVQALVEAEPDQAEAAFVRVCPDFLRAVLVGLPAADVEQAVREGVAAMTDALRAMRTAGPSPTPTG